MLLTIIETFGIVLTVFVITFLAMMPLRPKTSVGNFVWHVLVYSMTAELFVMGFLVLFGLLDFLATMIFLTLQLLIK